MLSSFLLLYMFMCQAIKIQVGRDLKITLKDAHIHRVRYINLKTTLIYCLITKTVKSFSSKYIQTLIAQLTLLLATFTFSALKIGKHFRHMNTEYKEMESVVRQRQTRLLWLEPINHTTVEDFAFCLSIKSRPQSTFDSFG